jgi:hypothetical protein
MNQIILDELQKDEIVNVNTFINGNKIEIIIQHGKNGEKTTKICNTISNSNSNSYSYSLFPKNIFNCKIDLLAVSVTCLQIWFLWNKLDFIH